MSGLEILVPIGSAISFLALYKVLKRAAHRGNEIRRLEAILEENGIHNGKPYLMIEEVKWYKRFRGKYNR